MKNDVLQDLIELQNLGYCSKRIIQKVNSGFYDQDIEEMDEGGASVEEISSYIQMS